MSKRLLMVSALLCFTTIKAQDRMTEIQAGKYISHLIDTLFIPTNHSGKYERQLKNFTNDVTSKLIRKLGSYPTFFSFYKTYSSNNLYQELVNESVNFIEKLSYDYAKEEVKDFYRLDSNLEQEIFTKISKAIREEISKVVNRSSELTSGVFSNYVGVPLVNKVRDMLKREINNALEHSKPKPSLYSTDECPICFRDFTSNVKRLFLTCGHNICVDCLRSWYNETGTRVSCAICRAPINISDFSSQIWPASAPVL